MFAVLLLACCGASAWLQMTASARHEREVTQRLSLGLAAHIAGNAELMQRNGLNPSAVHALFDKLMAVNPSVEVYLLDQQGRIVGQAAPAGHLKHDKVDLAPVRRLLAGAPLPILGDDPRGGGSAKVFSAAPLQADGRNAGYVYVVLSGRRPRSHQRQPGRGLGAAHHACGRWPWWRFSACWPGWPHSG